MRIQVVGLPGIEFNRYDYINYTQSKKPCLLKSVEAVSFSGSSLESALASDEGFYANNVTFAQLNSICDQIRVAEKSEIPSFFLERHAGIGRKFIAGGTFLIRDNKKYVAALYFLGEHMFVSPIALSTIKNTQGYSFLVIKEEGSA